MQGSRDERLARDFREMLKIQDRPYLSWVAVKGAPPYAEEYLLTVKLRYYALCEDRENYIVKAVSDCIIKVTLWDSYPAVAPNIRMLNYPAVFHPDWYSKGTYCPSQPWDPDCSLKEFILGMLSSLICAPGLAVSDTPANYKAADWYQNNRENSSLFPADHTALDENDPAQTAAAEKAALSFGETADSWAK